MVDLLVNSTHSTPGLLTMLTDLGKFAFCITDFTFPLIKIQLYLSFSVQRANKNNKSAKRLTSTYFVAMLHKL